MLFIWLQSSHFNPESVDILISKIGLTAVLIIGAGLEFAHFFEFGILYILIILAMLSYGKLSGWKEAVAAVISLFYGLVDEIHQVYVPFRSFSFFDLTKDIIGVLVVAFVIHKNYFYKTNSRLSLLLRKITSALNKGQNFKI
jgi:hypothetical protein